MNGVWKSLLTCVALLALLSGCASDRTIVQDLEQKEANEIIVLLAHKGIQANKVKQEVTGGGAGAAVTFMIQVAGKDRERALEILNQHGLPRPRGRNLLGIFGQGGLVPSEFEEKIKFQAGLEEQLASTIRRFEGVLDVAVQLSLPEENPLAQAQERKESTASVYIKHQGVLDDPNSQLKTKIRRLVASSIEGLKLENVTVIDERSRMVADPSLSPLGSADANREYVRIWSVIVATDSVGRFQVIFFSLSLACLILALVVVWILWKFMPLISAIGGFRSLLQMSPVQPYQITGQAPPDSEAEKEKAAEQAPPEKQGADEDEDEEELT